MSGKPKRHLTIEDVPQKFDSEGQPLCRICEGTIPSPRRTFCSEQCVHEYNLRANGSYAREQVFKRDRGICTKCGLDTEELRSLLYKIRVQKGEQVYKQLLNYYKEQYGWSFDLEKHFYEVDHKIPVFKGGGSCGLDNLQTLCVPCHRKKSMKEAQRRGMYKDINSGKYKDFGKDYY